MLVVEVCTSRLPSWCSLSVGSPDPSSTIATNDAQVSRAYRSSAPVGAAGAAAGPAGAEGASSPVSSAAARIGTSARSSLVGRIASSFDRRHQQRAATPMSRCRRLHCRIEELSSDDVPLARHHACSSPLLIEEATTSSQRSTPPAQSAKPIHGQDGATSSPCTARPPNVSRRLAHGPSGEWCGCARVRFACSIIARPRWWADLGPRRLRRQSQP